MKKENTQIEISSNVLIEDWRFFLFRCISLSLSFFSLSIYVMLSCSPQIVCMDRALLLYVIFFVSYVILFACDLFIVVLFETNTIKIYWIFIHQHIFCQQLYDLRFIFKSFSYNQKKWRSTVKMKLSEKHKLWDHFFQMKS